MVKKMSPKTFREWAELSLKNYRQRKESEEAEGQKPKSCWTCHYLRTKVPHTCGLPGGLVNIEDPTEPCERWEEAEG